MDRSDFQQAHGNRWAKIAADPAFFAALQYCDADSLKNLSRLTPQEIHDLAPEILAEFVGRLKLQNELIALSVPEVSEPLDIAQLETYAPPDDTTPASVRSESTTFAPVKDFASEFHNEETPSVKRRGRPPGSKNKKK